MPFITNSNIALGLLLAVANFATADTVSGEFIFDRAVQSEQTAEAELNDVFKPTQVLAFRVPVVLDPEKFVTVVLMTEQALDRKAISESPNAEFTAFNDDAIIDGKYLGFKVSPEGAVEMFAQPDKTQDQDVGPPRIFIDEHASLHARCSANTERRIACSIKGAKPIDITDVPAWRVDVEFDTAVLRHKDSQQP